MTIEYVVMDYEGEPTIIEDGQMWEAPPPRYYDDDTNELKYQVWNSEDCEWEDPPRESQYEPLDKGYYDEWCG